MNKKVLIFGIVGILLCTLVPLPEPVEGASTGWTMIVFMGGDNSLYTQLTADINEIIASSSPVDVIVLSDGKEKGDSRLYHIKNGVRTQITMPGGLGTEVNTGSITTYREIIKYTTANYPGSKYCLDFWDHGMGWGGIAFDETNQDYLDGTELMSVLSYGKERTNGYIDVVGFDACYMGQIDIMFNCKDYTDIFIASEDTEPWNGWDYRFLQDITDSTTKENFSKKVLNYYENQYAGTGLSYTLSAVNMTKFDLNVTENYNQLFQVIKQEARTEQANILTALGTTSSFIEQGYYRFYDLWGFSNTMMTQSSNADIDLHAGRLKTNITDAVIQHNGTAGKGISFYFSSSSSEYYPFYSTNQLSLYTSINEAQTQVFIQSDKTANVPDIPTTTLSSGVLTLSGDGVQYKIGRGPWVTSTFIRNTAYTNTVYYRNFNGVDYSEQRSITASFKRIVTSGNFAKVTKSLLQGWNVFTPFTDNTLTASSLCNQIGLSNSIVIQKADQGAFLFYRQGSPKGDFPMVLGNTYFVWVSEKVNVDFEGNIFLNQSIGLNKGLNLIGYHANQEILASDFVEGTDSVVEIILIQGTTFIRYFPAQGNRTTAKGTDFTITPGSGLYIRTTKTGGIEI